MKKTKPLVSLVVAVLMVSLLLITPPKATAQFVLAGWDYPDEYGQGIYEIQTEENTTGDWEPIEMVHYNENQQYLDLNLSMFIRLRVFVYMNNSVVGAEDLDDGESYQHLNVTVTQSNGTIVFSQEDIAPFLSYDTYDPIWLYEYYSVLNFLPDYGQIYTAMITYEVFY